MTGDIQVFHRQQPRRVGRPRSMSPRWVSAAIIVLVAAMPGPVSAAPSPLPSAAGSQVRIEHAQRVGSARVDRLEQHAAPSLHLPTAPPRPTAQPSTPEETEGAAADLGDRSSAMPTAVELDVAGSGGPGLASIGFAGRDDREPGCTSRPCAEPADSGLAVGPAHVLQVVAHQLAIHDRSGNVLEQVRLADFFGPLTDQAQGTYGETMPTVLWSPSRQRWLLSQSSWDCRHGFIELAVSQSSDPFAAWTLYAIDTGSQLASFPAMAASTDKIVITADHLRVDPTAPSCLLGGHRGGSFTIIDWADLLALPVSLRIGRTTPQQDLIAWRPAAGVSGGTRVDLVGALVRNGAWHVGYARVSGFVGGSGLSAVNLTDPVDLTAASGLQSFAAPPAPRVPGGSLDRAADARPTAAVARGSRLWFVASAPCTPSGDSVRRSCTRAVELDVGLRRAVQDLRLGVADWDTYGGGVGLARDGTAYLLFARSSSTREIRTQAAYRLPTDTLGTLRGTPLIIPSAGPYAGERWGRVTRLAADPADTRAVWQAASAPDSGGWATWVSQLRGGQTGGPGGRVTIDGGAAYSGDLRVRLSIAPVSGGATTVLRVSNTPEVRNGLLASAELTAAGRSMTWALDDAATGGSGAAGNRAVYVQFGDGAGRWSTVASDSIVVDLRAPTVSGPTPTLDPPATLTPSAIPVVPSWSRSDSVSGIAATQLQLETDGGTYGELAGSVALLRPGHAYRFRARARDGAGNWSAWAAGPSFRLDAFQETNAALSYLGTWTAYPNADAFGGGTRYATRPGSRVTLGFDGRAVGIVAAMGPTRGSADVLIDGVRAGSIDLYSSDSRVRQLAWARHWSSVGRHTVSLVVHGTLGHPRVDIDAFAVIR